MAETKKSSKFFTPGWIQVVVAFVVAIVTQGFGIYHFGMLKVPMTEALGAQPAEVALGFSIYALAAGFCADRCCAPQSCSRAVSSSWGS